MKRPTSKRPPARKSFPPALPDWRNSAVDALVAFARLVSERLETNEALELLADALMDHAAADAVAVVQVTADGLELAARRNLPAEVADAIRPFDEVGGELGVAVAAASGRDFAEHRTLPLVNIGGLFGAAIVLRSKTTTEDDPQRRVGRALVDLTASVLATSARIESLERTNEELRASRETLARTEKLRALGQMAAGVSHDLKNILNPLSLHLQLVERANTKKDWHSVAASVRDMKQALRRGVDTVERLRDFSRQSPESARRQVDLDQLAREAIKLAHPRLAKGGAAMSRVHDELGGAPSITAQPSEIVSALLNLIVNAADAMPDGGNITVRSGEKDGGAWVSVADDGPGMPADVQARVFEPFFTTKGEEGTGLGLAMVYATVQRHGGRVHLESEPGNGAKFTLWFPR